jgi:hypothetical protein
LVPPRVGDTPQIIRPAGTNKPTVPDSRAVSALDSAPAKDADHSASTYGDVYVNDLGRVSMFGKAAPILPPGSMIVREKLSSSSATKPDLLAVMIKRAKGFNPTANDWEFLVITGDGKKIERREKTGACQACHASEAKNDFVFRYPAP